MMRAWQGAFGAVAIEGMVSPAYVVARPTSSLDTKFVEHVLRTPKAIEQMRRYSKGITDFRLRLYWDEFKSVVVPVPPSNEVGKIIDWIGSAIANFDGLKSVATSAIDLLRERRSALISAAVTGQIDVRNLAPKDSAA